MIGAATGTAPEVDGGAGIDAGGVFPGQLQLDVGVQDLLACRAARVAILGGEQLIQPR